MAEKNNNKEKNNSKKKAMKNLNEVGSAKAGNMSKVEKEVAVAKKKKNIKTDVKPKKKKSTDMFIGMKKQEVISMFAQKPGDTGSPEVQVALASFKIANLAEHLNGNPKDNHSRRGLLKIISKRRRILNYLAGIDKKRYKDLISKVGLKK